LAENREILLGIVAVNPVHLDEYWTLGALLQFSKKICHESVLTIADEHSGK